MLTVKIIMYTTLFLVPVIMLIIGLRVKSNPPKEINNIKGYRTKLSMASQEAWDYANGRMGVLMVRSALYALIVSVVSLIIMLIIKIDPLNNIFTIVVCAVMVIQLVIVMLPMKTIEKELKEEVYKK